MVKLHSPLLHHKDLMKIAHADTIWTAAVEGELLVKGVCLDV